ncbi:MAG: TolC family protein [Phycisphaerales bacterium]|nr:TolC family protein [Phycisphaerales bacterium]
MRVLLYKCALATGAMLLAGGCATVDARRDYAHTAQEVERATGHTPLPRDAEAGVEEAVRALHADGLTADEAVTLALLNNPTARAALLQVGMARADVVQAGLWSNPTLGLSFRLPEGGGLSNIEAGLAQNIADLWMIPPRRRAAQRDLRRTVLETAQTLVGLAVDTKVAYFNAVAADDALAIARDNATLTRQLERVTNARLEAGTIGALDVNLAKGQALRADADVRTARLAAASARRTLATLLGMTGPADALELVDPLPAPREAALPVEHFEAVALAARLDARAARHAVRAAAERVKLEHARVFQNVELGVELERGDRRGQPGRKVLADTARASVANGGLTAPDVQSRGQRRFEDSQRIDAIFGPSLSVTLPLFDQNQAQIAKARMAWRQSAAALDGLERSIVQETREAADRLATAWEVAGLYEREILPQARDTLDLSESTYEGGQTTILNVIDAQRSLLELRRAQLAALQNAANAIAELERVTARPLGTLLGERPATQRRSDAATEGTADTDGAVDKEGAADGAEN